MALNPMELLPFTALSAKKKLLCVYNFSVFDSCKLQIRFGGVVNSSGQGIKFLADNFLEIMNNLSENPSITTPKT
jgi:hypothetical protein